MNVAETLLVFAGAPLAIIAVLALLIYVPAGRNRRPRYKPGQPWEHAPIWYEPHPEHAPVSGHGAHAALEAGNTHASTAGPLGGARGTW